MYFVFVSFFHLTVFSMCFFFVSFSIWLRFQCVSFFVSFFQLTVFSMCFFFCVPFPVDYVKWWPLLLISLSCQFQPLSHPISKLELFSGHFLPSRQFKLLLIKSATVKLFLEHFWQISWQFQPPSQLVRKTLIISRTFLRISNFSIKMTFQLSRWPRESKLKRACPPKQTKT